MRPHQSTGAMSAKEDRGGLEAQRELWESRWANVPAWVLRLPVPHQVRAASEQQWFPPGSQLLDIGCGAGNTARWLAQAGHRVTAIDVSATAIERARRAHSGQPNLTFAQHDICSGPPSGGPFGALLDWGCLHVMPGAGQEAYARNLAAVSSKDARLLVFHHAPVAARMARAVEDLLAAEFELMEAEECISVRGWPGVALRFQKRRK